MITQNETPKGKNNNEPSLRQMQISNIAIRINVDDEIRDAGVLEQDEIIAAFVAQQLADSGFKVAYKGSELDDSTSWLAFGVEACPTPRDDVECVFRSQMQLLNHVKIPQFQGSMKTSAITWQSTPEYMACAKSVVESLEDFVTAHVQEFAAACGKG